MRKITIAIDGHSSCGKSTMAKDLAKEIAYIYIDTGAMYRAVTLYCIQNGIVSASHTDTERLAEEMDRICISFSMNEQTGRPDTYLNGKCVESEIRSMETSAYVSRIAAIGFVREKMVELQREMGTAKGVVMDGRDIGTVVFPDAELKIFVTANVEVRAKRRYDELQAKGEPCNMEDIRANIQERDRIDSTRAVSPLRKADDAIVLDNSNMTKEEQNAWLLEQVRRATE